MSRGSNQERERLLRIIGLCVAVESQGSNPFEVQVQEMLELLRKYLPRWRALEDFVLDSETLRQIAAIVRLQSDWIKQRSTSLFVDPLLIEVKLRLMNTQRLVDAFEKSWHPVVEMEELSRTRIEQAIDYWNTLVSLAQRHLQLPPKSDALGHVTLEELIRRNIISEESFRKSLEILWEEDRKSVV